MVDGPGERASHTLQVGVAQEVQMLAARQGLVEEARIEVAPEGHRLADIDGQPHALDYCSDIVRITQISRINNWMLVGISGAQFEIAATPGTQQDGINGETGHLHVLLVVGPDLHISKNGSH